ncbi:MAG: hypothetical protein AAF611_16090 [Bacteroidota bacterium]
MVTKETYEWIERLLDPKVIEISDEEYDKLVRDYFREEKRSYNGKRGLSIKRRSKFWKLIRKFTMPKGKEDEFYDFSNFIFPQFQDPESEGPNSFWEGVTDNIFLFPVDFSKSTFSSQSNFNNVIFKSHVGLRNSEFHSKLVIKDSIFEGDVLFQLSNLSSLDIVNSNFLTNFSFIDNFCNGEVHINNNNFQGFLPSFYDSRFHKKVIFSNTTFSSSACRFNESIFFEDVEFFECKFQPKQKVEFQAVTFTKKVDFIRCEFWVDTHFNQSQFSGITVFDRPIFKEKVDFSFCNFEDITFKEINTYWSYRNNNYIESSQFYFRDVFFNSKTFFKNIDLNKLELFNCDVTNITFSRCIWNDRKNRLKLINEIPHKNEYEIYKQQLSGNELKKIKLKILVDKLRDSENHYRQLKKNFDSTKSWELSGKAYVSEMKMRQQRLWLEKKYYQWFIYWFYDFFGGYTQDFRKPIVSLLGLILVFSGIYFFIDYDIIKALQRGIKGALPYMQIDTENPFEGYWLILRNIQLVLGGTFLAFFILALRKRFKQ